MKISHLILQDSMGNKKTLLCFVNDGYPDYRMYGGTASSGIGHCLSNLQCNLPMQINNDETKDEFVERIKNVINNKSVCRVIDEIKPTKFKEV